MKTSKIPWILLSFALLFILYQDTGPKEGEVIIKQSYLDSITEVAMTPPDTVIKDTVVFRDTIIYKTVPVPVIVKDGISFYSDSIINDSTWIVINDSIKGSILNREIESRPIIVQKEITVTKKEPVYIKEKIELDLKTKLYGGIITGGNKDKFMSGVELGIITKKDNLYSFKVVTDFNQPFYMLGMKKIICFR